MKPQKIFNDLLNRMKSYPVCTIFCVDDFTDLYDAEIVRATLARMTNENKIVRLLDGYFTIPYYIEAANKEVFPSAQEMAEKIAEKYGWSILQAGEAALNNLGLSTQIPNDLVYISTGPYRDYVYRNNLIRFKHTSQIHALQFSKPLAMVIQAIREIGKDNLTEQEFRRLCAYCEKNVKENLIQDTKGIPSWIKKTLKNIAEVNDNEEISTVKRKGTRASISYSRR